MGRVPAFASQVRPTEQLSNKRRAHGRHSPVARRNTPTREAVIQYLCTTGIERIQREFNINCCVPASRIAKAVLIEFGIPSRYCAVKLQVSRGDAYYWVHGTGEETLVRGHVLGWDGHLILTLPIPGGEEILDLTLEQANRPYRGMVLQPLWADLTPDFWQTGVSGHELAGCVVLYERISSVGWKKMPGTIEAQLTRRLVAEIRESVTNTR